MKSLNRRFNNIQEKNLYWGSLVCFMETARGQRFSKDILYRSFNKLVDKDDYQRSQRKDILKNVLEANKEVLSKKERYFFTEKYYSK